MSEEEYGNYGIATSWKALGGDLFPLAEYLEGTLAIYGAPHFNESVEEVNLKGFKSLKSAIDSISEEKVAEGVTALYEEIFDWFDGFHHDPPGDGFSVTFSKRNLKILKSCLMNTTQEATHERTQATKRKSRRARKLYKHMNGKEPEKITKQKIDVGDVWYQVGEGGCWQIGYMSGKETGSSSQKYTHTFNEETQDGNFPKALCNHA